MQFFLTQSRLLSAQTTGAVHGTVWLDGLLVGKNVNSVVGRIFQPSSGNQNCDKSGVSFSSDYGKKEALTCLVVSDLAWVPRIH